MNIPNDLKRFRTDFAKAVKELEKQYDVNISIGSITYEDDEFRTKLTVRNGEKAPAARVVKSNEFNVGDIVGINHRKVDSDQIFTVFKINNKNIKVKNDKGQFINVHPSLLVKK